MNCGQDRNVLAAYLDGEATPEQERQVREHLQSCGGCAAEITALVSLRRKTKAAGARFAPSPDFRRKMQAQVSSRRPRMTIFRFVTAGVLSLAAMMLVFVWTRQEALQADTFREVADLHVSDLASANPYDVVSSDRHTVKPWFQGRIPFSFNLPELTGTQFILLGGRVVYLRQEPAAQVIVGAGQHKISMIVTQETVMRSFFPLSHAVNVRDSFNVETWSSHGLRFFVIGDAEKEAIQKLAQAVHDVNQ